MLCPTKSTQRATIRESVIKILYIKGDCQPCTFVTVACLSLTHEGVYILLDNILHTFI